MKTTVTPILLNVVPAMPLMEEDNTKQDELDEENLMQAVIEHLLGMKQMKAEPNASPPHSKKGKKFRKARTSKAPPLPYMPDLPAMVARAINKAEASNNPKCIEALNKEWDKLINATPGWIPQGSSHSLRIAAADATSDLYTAWDRRTIKLMCSLVLYMFGPLLSKYSTM